MLTISLEAVKFQAAHGVYPEERVLENTFLVDASVRVADPGEVKDLSQTVDYEKMHGILRDVMATPHLMLETLADQAVKRIAEAFPRARHIRVRIAKLNPPLPGEVGRSVIELSRDFPA
jgi:dihydroneopterin aldolase